jgi:hypothetical protein
VSGVPTPSPASVTVFIVFGLAEAKTSAGAPEVICCARAELPAYEKVTFVPGLAASKSLPIWVKDSVSEAAASTVIVPLTPAAEPVPPEGEPLSSELPHAAVLTSTPASVTAARSLALICRPLVPRPRWST